MSRLAVMLSAALLALTAGAVVPTPSQAVVYCTGPGLPVGCVVRPAPRVVYCTRPGYPAGCVAKNGVGVRPGVGAGAAGVGVTPGVGVGAPGYGANAGGPVNRVGVR